MSAGMRPRRSGTSTGAETSRQREALRAVRASVLEDDDVLRWDAVFALGVIGGRNDLVLLKRILASELARETPNARIVEETEEMIASMRARRDSRWPRR